MNFINKFQRQILIVAAIANFIGAIGAIVSPSFFFTRFFKIAPDPATTFPYVAMYHYLFWGFVLIMGIANWMAAIDPIKNKVVLMISGFGKILAAAFWIMLFAQGQGRGMMISAAVTDGIFGMLMLYWFFKKEADLNS